MARRKEFKTITEGLVCSFVSRNNDVYGYWGIGKLYSLMVENKSMNLVIDLLNQTISPPNNEFEKLINEFHNKLFTQIHRRNLNLEFLKDAKIKILGFPDTPSPYFGRIAPNKVICILEITDDKNKIHKSEANTWCREHDPKKELKSTREY